MLRLNKKDGETQHHQTDRSDPTDQSDNFWGVLAKDRLMMPVSCFFSANGAFHTSLGRSPREKDLEKRRAESPFHSNGRKGVIVGLAKPMRRAFSPVGFYLFLSWGFAPG
jgi:hypothetical protein